MNTIYIIGIHLHHLIFRNEEKSQWKAYTLEFNHFEFSLCVEFYGCIQKEIVENNEQILNLSYVVDECKYNFFSRPTQRAKRVSRKRTGILP